MGIIHPGAYPRYLCEVLQGMSDGELDICIARTAAGDPRALYRLYDELGGAVFALAKSVTGDGRLAEDVLQDVFIRVHAGAKKYRAGGKPRAWVMRIARNEAVSTLRRRRREIPADSPADESAGGEGGAEAVPDRLELDRALGDLAPVEREIVLLSVLGGLPNREVAKLLGIPAGSVSWRYRAAMKKLRESLSAYVL
jgi:RNA polymerase sigma-70 factor (ECF subfamily)